GTVRYRFHKAPVRRRSIGAYQRRSPGIVPRRSRPPRRWFQPWLILVEIFSRDVVFRDFVAFHFAFALIRGFDTGNDLGLERVAFFKQLGNAFGARTFTAGQSLQISGKLSGLRWRLFDGEFPR